MGAFATPKKQSFQVPPSWRTSRWRLYSRAFVDPPFWLWGPVWAKFGKPGGSRLWPQVGRVPRHPWQPMAPDEPLASRFPSHRPMSACDVTVSIDLGMLTATPLSLLTPLRRRLQGGSQGGSGQRVGWGRLVYAQPVRCESAAGSSCSRALSECTTTSNVHVETNLRSTNQSTSSNVILSEDY